MTTPNVIPVSFPKTPASGARKPKPARKPATQADYLRDFSEKARAHPDAEIIASSIEYCVATAGSLAAYAPDPTDSYFSAGIDTRLLRKADRIAERLVTASPKTADGLHALGHVALLMSDSKADPCHITGLNQDFLNNFARCVLRHCKQLREARNSPS